MGLLRNYTCINLSGGGVALMAFFRLRNDEQKQDELVEWIAEAQKEWLLAKNQLNEISDPELIDYAVYRLNEAERRYMYLLKKAGKEKVGCV